MRPYKLALNATHVLHIHVNKVNPDNFKKVPLVIAWIYFPPISIKSLKFSHVRACVTFVPFPKYISSNIYLVDPIVYSLDT